MADQCAMKPAGGDQVESSEPVVAPTEPVCQKPVAGQESVKEVAPDNKEAAEAQPVVEEKLEQSNGHAKNEDAEAAPAVEKESAEEPVESSEAQPEEKSHEDNVQADNDKTVEPVAEKKAEEAAPVVAEEANGKSEEHTNGDAKVSEAAPAEENGCQLRKRKNSNGVEATEEDNSPKKAKLVDESDNAKPVEETAA